MIKSQSTKLGILTAGLLFSIAKVKNLLRGLENRDMRKFGLTKIARVYENWDLLVCFFKRKRAKGV